MESVLEKLQSIKLQSILKGSDFACINLRHIESDGRKRKSLKRLLLEEGLLREVQGSQDFIITVKVLESIESKPPELEEIWEESYTNNFASHSPVGFVPLFNLDVSEVKHVLESMQKNPSSYTIIICRRAFEPSVWNQRFQGSFEVLESMQDLGLAYKEAYQRFTEPNTSNVSRGFDIYVGSMESQIHGNAILGDEYCDRMVNENLDWGLIEFCGLTEDDVEGIKSRELALPSLGRGAMAVFTSSDKWGEQIGVNIDFATKQIERLANLSLKLHRIQKNVESFGGWDKLIAEMKISIRNQMAEALKPSYLSLLMQIRSTSGHPVTEEQFEDFQSALESFSFTKEEIQAALAKYGNDREKVLHTLTKYGKLV